MKPTVTVLSMPGTNCQAETARAFRDAGAAATIVLLADVLAGRERIDGADILCVAGGFSFGDHLGAGRVASVCLRGPLRVQFEAARARPMLGICNGFQILADAGAFGDGVRLSPNAQGRFCNRPRQRHIVRDDNPSFWLDGLGGAELVFPCAHGEGRFEASLESGWQRAIDYPAGDNPDGSWSDVAGVTSADGLVLGMMDHPERTPADAPCRALFANAVSSVR